MAGGLETRWKGGLGTKKGHGGDTEKNVRFAGGLNTRREDTGNWGVRERGHE